VCGLDLTGPEYGLFVEFCEHGYEPLPSIKGGEFLDQLSDYQFFKVDCATWIYV
jgi:hypothetical protein